MREWQVGDRVADLYEVRDVVRSGGMGLVYRARHLTWEMDLAVKVPRPELVGQRGLRRRPWCSHARGDAPVRRWWRPYPEGGDHRPRTGGQTPWFVVTSDTKLVR